MIVSESAARAVWPNQEALGKVWDLAAASRTVVGVVKDSGANVFAVGVKDRSYDIGGEPFIRGVRRSHRNIQLYRRPTICTKAVDQAFVFLRLSTR